MFIRSSMRRLRLTTAVGAVLMVLAACSGTPAPETSVQPVPEVAQTTPTAAPSSNADTAAAAQAYFSALVTEDPDEDEAASKDHAAPKSIAAAYAQHLANVRGADLDGGLSSDAEDLITENGTYGYCPDGDTDSKDCVTWGDVQFSGGKVSTFTINKVDISKRITLGSGDAVKAGKLADITFLSAYQSVQSKAVFVALEVKTNKRAVTVITYDSKYRDQSGHQRTATQEGGPSEIDADSTARIYAAFKSVKPGGVLTLDVTDSKNYDTKTVKIKTS